MIKRVYLIAGVAVAASCAMWGCWFAWKEHGRRRLADIALRDSEEKYRAFVDAVRDYAVYSLDLEGTIIDWNTGAEHIYGYTGDQILGKNFSQLFSSQDKALERPKELLRMTAVEGRHEERSTRIRKDGTRFLARVTFSVLRDGKGAPRGYSGVSRNLSESEASAAKYRGLMEAAPDAMVVVNQSGAIVILNARAEKQFGYLRDELIGQPIGTIVPEGFAERLMADALRSKEVALAQEIGGGIELFGRRKDGSVFPIEIMLSPLASPGELLVTAAIRDITIRTRAEATLLQKVVELRHSNEELAQFALVASHDLQEPLRMVASYTQLLAKRYKGKLDADADEFIAFAVDGATRMQQLIQDLLAYSRVGSKGKDLVDTSSEAALQQALLNLRGAIEESGAQVTYGAMPAVLADDIQLVQLFQNLVGNGIKYQSAGVPRIHISALEAAASKWIFSVKDNGLGIDALYFKRIFGMFQRLHTREEFTGTGVGLAICKKIVERHGGDISVESDLGKGSTFRFALAAGGASQ